MHVLVIREEDVHRVASSDVARASCQAVEYECRVRSRVKCAVRVDVRRFGRFGFGREKKGWLHGIIPKSSQNFFLGIDPVRSFLWALCCVLCACMFWREGRPSVMCF